MNAKHSVEILQRYRLCVAQTKKTTIDISSGVLRGGQGARLPVRAVVPRFPLMKLVAKHSSCIHSVASHSWCQITPLIQSCVRTFGIFEPLPNTDVATPLGPAGHPKLLQLETPLLFSKSIYWW